MPYPEEITLTKGTPQYDFLMEHSGLIRDMILSENGDSFVIGKWLFPDDEYRWKLFYDIFFPESMIEPVFRFTTNAEGNKVAGVRNPRGSLDDVYALFDYLLIGTPETMEDRIVNIVKLHRKLEYLNDPLNTVPRGAAPQKRVPGKGAAAALQARVKDLWRKVQTRSGSRIWSNWNASTSGTFNEPENENEKVAVGLTEEEEALRETLAPSLQKYVTSNLVSRKAKRTKKTKKQLAKTRRRLAHKKQLEQLYKNKYRTIN